MSLLFYHAIESSWSSPLSVAPEVFSLHCAWLSRHRQVVELSTALQAVDARGRLPRRMVSLTFDDGFASVYESAFPELIRYGLPATVFLVAGTLGNGDGMTPELARWGALKREQVLEMQEAGIRFESHSYAHRILTSLSEEECERDLRRSRETLEELLQQPVSILAYPGGFHDQRVRRAAETAGYQQAVGTSRGRDPVGPLAIPRIGVYPRDRAAALRLKTTPWYVGLRRNAMFPVVKRLAGRAPKG